MCYEINFHPWSVQLSIQIYTWPEYFLNVEITCKEMDFYFQEFLEYPTKDYSRPGLPQGETMFLKFLAIVFISFLELKQVTQFVLPDLLRLWNKWITLVKHTEGLQQREAGYHKGQPGWEMTKSARSRHGRKTSKSWNHHPQVRETELRWIKG